MRPVDIQAMYGWLNETKMKVLHGKTGQPNTEQPECSNPAGICLLEQHRGNPFSPP